MIQSGYGWKLLRTNWRTIPACCVFCCMSFRNKTAKKKHSKREHNPPTQTHMNIKRTYIYLTTLATTEDSCFLTKDFNTLS
jgi:hypothetical protein